MCHPHPPPLIVSSLNMTHRWQDENMNTPCILETCYVVLLELYACFFVSSWKLLSLEELNCLKYQSQSSPCHIWALNCTERKPKCVCSVLVCFSIQCVMCSVAALLTVSHSSSNKSSIPFLITLLFPFIRLRWEYAFINMACSIIQNKLIGLYKIMQASLSVNQSVQLIWYLKICKGQDFLQEFDLF